ncbi:MAG: SH3 domain-containing protein [Rhodobacteraceae bacterium]|uniref:SH3 domain-containing protein n=1 Tax=Salipiger thiooxidans TaxID=282683 RepID=UPI001A901F7F|nr:SH3 domain-containing protein [Salipiger thiooxidans]MBN8188134.1 SH3 domain-containing protein [Salipiger thiooxidans]MBR9839471.1 SH3 domain-containing protein [Paracoccaceae bacterium]
MRGPAIRTLAAGVLSAIVLAQPAAAAWREKFEVYGVAEGDMLKMRGGPGTGFDVWVGLPNGTVVRVHECTQTGSTRWCEVSLERARSLRGWVSWAYLREL